MSDSALLEKINRIFWQNSAKNPMTINGKCNICGEKTMIEIVKTSGGFGVNGGMVRETGHDRMNPICLGCYSNGK